MLDVRIDGARVIGADGSVAPQSVGVEDGCIRLGVDGLSARRTLDGKDHLLAPGIIDVHGDAFERQIMPRPGVGFDIALALADTDRQLVANGITTAHHGVTYSWEPGLRGRENCLVILETMERMADRLACDTRFHLRFETFNLDGADDVAGWLDEGRLGILAFNDHAREIAGHVQSADSKKATSYVDRTGLDREGLVDLVNRVVARADEVPEAIAALAEHARRGKVAMLSHDDPDPETRLAYRAMGCHVAEFPETEETARVARDGGEAVVMGAPNVVRGGSHNGSICAAEMIGHGLCDVLASDYYYPAQLMAAFRLARNGSLDLGESWALISGNAARAVGLDDRGAIADGKRADLVLIDDRNDELPRVAATLVAGRLAYLSGHDVIAA